LLWGDFTEHIRPPNAGLRDAPEQHQQRSGSTCAFSRCFCHGTWTSQSISTSAHCACSGQWARCNGFCYITWPFCWTASCAMAPRLVPNQVSTLRPPIPPLAAECVVAVGLVRHIPTMRASASSDLRFMLPESCWSVLKKDPDVRGLLSTPKLSLRSCFMLLVKPSSSHTVQTTCRSLMAVNRHQDNYDKKSTIPG
jgi:hypothetical protein